MAAALSPRQRRWSLLLFTVNRCEQVVAAPLSAERCASLRLMGSRELKLQAIGSRDAVETQMQPRGSREAAERQPRGSRAGVELQPRCSSRHLTEVSPR